MRGGAPGEGYATKTGSKLTNILTYNGNIPVSDLPQGMAGELLSRMPAHHKPLDIGGEANGEARGGCELSLQAQACV